MIVWKLGCRWGSKTPIFFEFIKSNKIVISYYDKPFQKGDWILIANGHTVLALAKVTNAMHSCLLHPKYEDEFKKLQIPFEDNLIVANADWIVLQNNDQFKYQLQQGICKVQNIDTIEVFNKTLKKYTMKLQNESLVKLLKQKKQIILQGPPGTGKTRLAQELASQICTTYIDMKTTYGSPDVDLSLEQKAWSNANIAENLVSVESVPSSTGRTTYKIKNIKNDRCTVLLESNSKYEIPFKGIRDAYRSKLWLGGQSNGLDPYNAAIAKYLYENLKIHESIIIDETPFIPKLNNDDFTLIQFHPSYTYEDFVRGIVVNNNNNNNNNGEIEYITENKILAEIAEKALNNYTNHFKDNTAYNYEVRLKEYFNLFTDNILDAIEEQNGFLKLTDNIGLINVDDDAFRYKGKNEGWIKNGNRMLFKDILQAFTDNNKERQDIKRNKKLSGLAKQHASYYIRVLNLFYKFLKDNNLSFDSNYIEKEPLKDYVLIIDEINRANLPTVLGELIYALEYRGKEVQSIYDIDGEKGIIIPPNLYIIGTMNTADRSVGHIDYAIRRRFAFVDVLPSIINNVDLDEGKMFMTDKFKEVSKLFLKNFDDYLRDNNVLFVKSEYLSDEFRVEDMWLGHSYFIADNQEDFNFKLKYEIKPILKEYVKDGILNEVALELINGL